MDLNGDATAVWVENGLINTSYQPVNGSYGGVTTLSTTATASSPALGVDGNGNVTAVWVESDVIMTSTFNGSSWSLETAISQGTSLNPASNPVVAVDSTGNIVAAWIRSGFIESSTKPFGGTGWSNVSPISAASSDNPSVAIGGSGTVCAVWHSVVSGSDEIFSATQTINSITKTAGPWSSPLTIASGGFSHNYPKVVVDVNGNSTVVWFRYVVAGSNYDSVQVATSTLVLNGAAWSPVPTFLSGFGSRNPAGLSLKIVTDNEADLVAFWSQSYDGATFNIEGAQQISGGSWTPLTQLIVSNNYAFQGDVSSSLLDEILVGFMYFDGTNVVIQACEASMKGILSEIFFSQLIEVTSGGENGFVRVASAFVSGTETVYAGAAWLSSNGTNTTVQAANGTRTAVLPPTNLHVSQTMPPNNFGIFTEYANTLTWDASASPNIQAYFIYRDGIQVTDVASSVLEYVDHNQVQNGAVTYGIIAVDDDFSPSQEATKSFP